MNTEERLEKHSTRPGGRPEESETADSESTMPFQLILMGAAGSGKTVVGLELAGMTGWDFYDADDFHAEENKAKMRGGTPLSDEDRKPWLRRLHDLLARYAGAGEQVLLACSALKRRYRDVLAEGLPAVRFVYLEGSFETLRRRMELRKDHYMKPGMLESQFEALEEPGPDEAAVTVDADTGSPGATADEILRRMKAWS